MVKPPSGTVTFLFTDIEGSTKLWERYPVAMRDALARHDAILRAAIESNNGYVFKTIGDAFCAAFPSPHDGLHAALAAQQALTAEPWPETGPIRARMALHTGEVTMRDGDYFGPPVNRVARLLAAGHGGQILLSQATWNAVQGSLPQGVGLQDMGKQRLKDIGQREHISQVLAPGLPTVFPKLKTPPSPFPGAIAGVLLALLALALYPVAFGYRSFSLDLLTPSSFVNNLTDLVVRLSTQRDSILLIAVLLLVAVTTAAVLVWRHATRFRRHRGNHLIRLVGRRLSLRSVAFMAVATLLVAGAYSYQQYLWRWELPVPEGRLGLALTREASAASLNTEVEDALENGGSARPVVVRDLPVYFDANDDELARDLGDRIDAKVVVIYSEDASGPVEDGRYAASVVFTNPLSLAGLGEVGSFSPEDANASTALPAGLELRARTQEEVFSHLVNAAAGIIAYDDNQFAVAVALLENAHPEDLEAPNAGLVNHYLGLAYRLNGQVEEAEAAQDRAIAAYDQRLAARGALGTQDQLLLVKAYAERCFQAGMDEQWEDSIATCEKATTYRDALVAKSGALHRPADVELTYFWLYGLLADAYRADERPEDEAFWRARAQEEAQALGARADAEDPFNLIYQAKSYLFSGDCVGGVNAVNRALALDIADPRLRRDAHNNLGTLYYFQGRYDLAERHWREAAALNPDDPVSRENLASLLVTIGLGNTFIDPAAHALFPEYAYIDPSAIARAEEYYGQILAIDPTNQEAHDALADVVWWRAQGAAVIDGTASVNGDDLSVAKSQALWDLDPARVQAAIDAYGTVIQARRTLASELRPADAQAHAAVAAAYQARVDLLYGGLLSYAIYGAADPSQDDEWVAATGARLLADVAQVREWSDRALADPDASRLATLTAWQAKLAALQREWGWYAFFAVDPPGQLAPGTAWYWPDAFFSTSERDALRLEEEYGQAVSAAVAFVEAAPIGDTDELEPARAIYFEASTFAQLIANDQAASGEYQDKAFGLSAQESTERTESIEHQTTRCLEMREQTAGDAARAGGDLAEAQTHYAKALEHNPQHVPALIGSAKSSSEQRDPQRALAQAQAATEADPNDPRAWATLAFLQVLRGDTTGADASYDRYLAAVAPLGPQARMASLRAAIGDLRSALDADPGLAPRIAPLVPRFGAALDTMTDADDTYQYPALYAQLGALTLYAGDAATAEPLLRSALTLDPHQPRAWADLVLAARTQGRADTAEIDGAARELLAPVWLRVDGYDAETVRSRMEQEAEAYGKRFPDRTTVYETFGEDLEAARQRQALRQSGMSGTIYSSPSHDFGLTLDTGWSVLNVTSENGYDSLYLGDGVGEVLVTGMAANGASPAACVETGGELARGQEGVTDVAPAVGPNGEAIAGSGDGRAHAGFTYSREGKPLVLYVECRSLPDTDGNVQVMVEVPAASYDAQKPRFDALLARLQSPLPPIARFSWIADAPVPGLYQAGGLSDLALPAIDVSALVSALPGVSGSSYTSPGYGYQLGWDDSWTAVTAASDGSRDVLQLANGESRVYVEAFAGEGGPAGCASAVRDELVNEPTFSDLAIMTDAAGKPLRGQIEGGVYTVFTYTRTPEGQAPAAEALYLSCTDLGGGNVLRVEHFAVLADYEAQAVARESLLAGLVLKP